MSSAQSSFACCDRCANLRLGEERGITGERSASRPRDMRAGTLSVPDSAVAVAGPPAGLASSPAAASSAMVARRRFLKAAVFRPPPDTAPAAGAGNLATWLGTGPSSAQAGTVRPRAGFADTSRLSRTVSGIVLDVSPHIVVIGQVGNEQRYTLTPEAVAWRGTQLEPAALREGDHAVVRLHPSSRHVADRIWANIGRVTGIITERSGSTLIVDEGTTRKVQVIRIQPRAVGRIQVRFPTLEPGYLVDIIGLRDGDELIGMIPATSQPAYPVTRLPEPALVSGRVPNSISGSATWHEPRDEPPGILGVAYPALDPETRCAEDVASGGHHGYARMPYLALGSVLRVTNDCTGMDCLMPVTGCASIARLFNDRCVTCGTSPRGRIADLTLASFIALGGELERGCFNATIMIGE